MNFLNMGLWFVDAMLLTALNRVALGVSKTAFLVGLGVVGAMFGGLGAFG